MLPSRGEATNEVDVLVIGGGVVGAATALAAARLGGRVALTERSGSATATGSSKGTARIYAPAAYPDDSYLEMGLRGLERWREIEAEVGEELLCPTGALSVGEFAERELPALRAAGVDAELISSDQARRRFGVRVPRGHPLLHQPDAGVMRADRALAALLRLARDAGVEIHAEEPVGSIDEHADWVEVESESRRWRCSAVIAAAGPWNVPLLARAGLELPLAVSSQSVAHFDLSDRSARPIAVMDYEGEEPYALWEPERGLKAAFHRRGPLVDPDDDDAALAPDAIDRLAEWVRGRFPAMTNGLVGTESCLYTNTPGERFILERRGRIVVAAACNGQGFQFAPETGERVAQLALEPAGLATP